MASCVESGGMLGNIKAWRSKLCRGLMSFLAQPPTMPISFMLTTKRHGQDERGGGVGGLHEDQCRGKTKHPQHEGTWRRRVMQQAKRNEKNAIVK